MTKYPAVSSYWMLFIAFAAFNVAVGLTFGAIGLLIEPLAGEFSANNSQISVAIALIAVIAGLASPFVGALLDRWSIRGTLLIGGAIGIVAFYWASHARSINEFLLAFGVLGGIAYTMVGVLPANKLASLWFPDHLGRVSGIVNLSLLNAIGPPLFSVVIVTGGWRELMQVFAAIYIGLLLLCLWVRLPPVPAPVVDASAAAQAPASADIPPYRKPLFWIVSICIGLLNGSGVVLITYIVAHAQVSGIPATTASVLLSVLGVASIIGAPLYGWLSDRIGPFRALLLNASLQVALWPVVASTDSFTGLVVVVTALALCTGGAMPMAVAMIGRGFPQRQFGMALGQMTLAMLPMIASAAPVAGLIFDLQGHYRGAFLLEMLLCGLALLGVWLNRQRLRGL